MIGEHGPEFIIPDSIRRVTADMIAARLGVQTRTVHQWRRRYDDFPKPYSRFGNRPVWYWKFVAEWAEKRGKCSDSKT